MYGSTSYTTVSQQSASQEQLVILLYERAIRGQLSAIESLTESDRAAASPELRRCREIFVELAGALDHDAAPELAGNLHRLYMWLIRQMLTASRTGEATAVEDALEVTESLYEALREALL